MHGSTHTHKKTDIAKQHVVTEIALTTANPFSTWASLREGEKILIPVRT
ncbi:hypothetical protein KKD52_12950 [Myxococcota bacterium]|nr:hypothetical protein [Myxococcota bacterium]MBU1413518.1 hypothetical protein [Myxococcota bacterium]MBU1511261.1 hypothetical protein [Myxococcota bacterium]